MNVLQVTPANVYPPTNGSDHRTQALMSSFVENKDTVYRFCQLGQISTYRNFEFQKRIQMADSYIEIRARNPIYEVARVTAGLLPNHSSLDALAPCLRHLPPPYFRKLLEWADAIIVRGPWQLPVVAAAVRDTPVIYSVHGTRVPSSTAERTALEQADVVLHESQWTVEEYERRFGVGTPYIVAPVATYDEHVRDSTVESKTRDQTRYELGIGPETLACLFVGTVHDLNVEAALRMYRVAEAANESGIDIHVVVVGSVGTVLPEAPPNVSVLGFVDDLEPYFDAADVGVNPATESEGGPNIKMLDYFARKLPVVTSERGARGLDITDGEHAFIRPPESTLDALEALGSDDSIRERIAESGQNYVVENHTWSRVSAQFRSDVLRIVEEGTDHLKRPRTNLASTPHSTSV